MISAACFAQAKFGTFFGVVSSKKLSLKFFFVKWLICKGSQLGVLVFVEKKLQRYTLFLDFLCFMRILPKPHCASTSDWLGTLFVSGVGVLMPMMV